MTKKIRLLLIAVLVILPILLMLSACGECEHANLTDEKVITPATCTADGKGSHVCADCQEIIEFVIPATGHTEVIDAGVDYTCTADGITEGKHCSTCNEVLVAQQVLPAAHRPSEWIITKPVSCEIDGYRIKNCTVCEERVASEAITKTGHLESDWEITKAAACEATGAKRTTCLNCQEVMQTAVIPATGHDESGWVITLNATCEASGSKHTVCNTCEVEMQTAVIDPLGHNMAWSTTLEATCTATGIKQYKCTRCPEITDEQIINAKGHLYTTNVIDPTCVLDGYTKHSCTRCTYFYTDSTVVKTGHSYTSVVTQPTCVDAGYTTHTCNTCGDTVKDNITQPLGHAYLEKTTKATCKSDGEIYDECTRCSDHVTLEKLPMFKHTAENLVATTQNKDMGGGTTRVATILKCPTCDHQYVRKIVYSYSKPDADKWLNINTGWTYGMSVDRSDLTTTSLTSFKVEVTTSFTISNSWFEKETFADIFITPKGEGIDNKLAYLEFLDKTSAVSNSVGSKSIEDDSKPWTGVVDFPVKSLIDDHVYFVFMNFNASSGYRIHSISATAVFDYGDPKVN